MAAQRSADPTTQRVARKAGHGLGRADTIFSGLNGINGRNGRKAHLSRFGL